jgi:hypothetical protein
MRRNRFEIGESDPIPAEPVTVDSSANAAAHVSSRAPKFIEVKFDLRRGAKFALFILIIIFWLSPSLAAAQYVSVHSSHDRLSVLQGIMPDGAVCSNLAWEPVSYCRYYSKGATLEIWAGANGPGASLSFDASGNEGIVLLKIIRKHFSILGIPLQNLNRCIHRSEGIQLELDERLFDLGCNVVELSTSVGLEIIPAPSRSVLARQK